MLWINKKLNIEWNRETEKLKQYEKKISPDNQKVPKYIDLSFSLSFIFSNKLL